jgi:hypothetical protein
MLDLGSIWLRAGMDVGSAAQVRTHKVMLHTAQSKFQQGPLEMETASPAPKEHPRTPPTTNIRHHGHQKLKSRTEQVGRDATQMASPPASLPFLAPARVPGSLAADRLRPPSRRSPRTSPSAAAAFRRVVTLVKLIKKRASVVPAAPHRG